MINIDGVCVKLNRSESHIADLERKVKVFLSSQPFGLIKLEEPNGDLVYRIKINHAIPTEWSAIVGDAVHNMRSALDLLAWQFVEANGGKPTHNTCFPIGKLPPPDYDRILRKALVGASPKAIRFVRRLKPYVGGNILLTQLHSLDISDKHRLVLIVGAAHKHVVLKVKMPVPWQQTPVEMPPIAINPADRQFPLHNGLEVFRIRAAAREADNMSDYQIVFELAFGEVPEVEGFPLLETLSSMQKHIVKIVDLSERIFS